MSKSAHEQSFYCSQIQRFYCCQILDHVSVSRILGLALLTFEKMAAHAGENDDCVLSFLFFCQKTTCLVQNRNICEKNYLYEQSRMDFLAV